MSWAACRRSQREVISQKRCNINRKRFSRQMGDLVSTTLFSEPKLIESTAIQIGGVALFAALCQSTHQPEIIAK